MKKGKIDLLEHRYAVISILSKKYPSVAFTMAIFVHAWFEIFDIEVGTRMSGSLNCSG
jgi:hypothetical protein